MRRTVRLCVSLVACLAVASLLEAQTATTGLVTGSITDTSAAVIPGAAVELVETTTKATVSQKCNEAGQFVFPNVPPGLYRLTAKMQGFRTAAVQQLRVEVTRSYTQNLVMEVGEVTETIEVAAQAQAELQMVDSTVGNVLSGTSIPVLPTFTRQVNELLTLQPGATPGGEVSGTRADQSTFSLDGIDVTNQSVGGLNTYMYLGVEGVSEF